MKKQRMRRKSIVKISLKEKDKLNVAPHEEIGRIMKIKIGITDERAKKFSPYYSEKPMLKNVKHKK